MGLVRSATPPSLASQGGQSAVAPVIHSPLAIASGLALPATPPTAA
ncbi:MAG: hypothetical protein JNJ46_33635 [Myxococcales bacterium]|nr:hypothetical protein [Myxococcales bacterium]